MGRVCVLAPGGFNNAVDTAELERLLMMLLLDNSKYLSS